MKAYIDGARAGAPQATQVADRFHLLQNLAETLDQVFSTHGAALKAVSDAWSHAPVAQPDGRMGMPVPPSTPTPQAQIRAAQRRAWRLATYEHVWRLHRQGWSNRTIARHLGIGRVTVMRCLQAPTFPERKGRSDTGKSVLWHLKLATSEEAFLCPRHHSGTWAAGLCPAHAGAGGRPTHERHILTLGDPL